MFLTYRQENVEQSCYNHQFVKIILVNSLCLITCELNGTYKK
jgi:hypothetical protein